ncbi:lipase maturation factor family protein [Mycolicibacterium sp. P9-22]|uniref:lipase maturation factor family protein n=1 Tax=Mycolicibacterium sp. P9-22 TaxID=2024613 RepID=UPI0011F022F5|nr:lipase maturation factor family protein [Mycolicibacterium sp. P9-22]KAA0110400.1 lipase maturation factor family protein [Mycolicibacterium sp. P9-22]
MDWLAASESWWGRLALERGIAAIYVVAFLCAALQFRGLLGTSGMTPIPKFLEHRSFRSSPSVFHLHYSDRFFAAVCWSGVAVSVAMVIGLADLVPLWGAMALWLGLWMAYLSIVNVGQVWYSFGWESLLLEAGFLAVFLGNDETAPPLLVLILARWLLFRVEFGAGMIKIRGDRCWRDLTCLDYHHETQPMPGPLSWFFHRLPKPLHRVEVAGNHFAQLVVPFGLFAPQPVAGVAAAVIIVTQLWLVASGNFAWLNWLTIVLACGVLDDGTYAALFGWTTPADAPTTVPTWFGAVVIAFAVLVVVLSWRPARNLLSRRQRMNSTFDPLHLVNSYGAFGSVGKIRHEVVFEGTSDAVIDEHTEWREYGFKGKPGEVARTPRQCSPYHLRLDWLMWFAAISPSYARPWIGALCEGMLSNDTTIMKLLRHNPFPDRPPAHVRALLYRYRFTTASELIRDRAWWHREPVGEYLAPVVLGVSGRATQSRSTDRSK